MFVVTEQEHAAVGPGAPPGRRTPAEAELSDAYPAAHIQELMLRSFARDAAKYPAPRGAGVLRQPWGIARQRVAVTLLLHGLLSVHSGARPRCAVADAAAVPPWRGGAAPRGGAQGHAGECDGSGVAPRLPVGRARAVGAEQPPPDTAQQPLASLRAERGSRVRGQRQARRHAAPGKVVASAASVRRAAHAPTAPLRAARAGSALTAGWEGGEGCRVALLALGARSA